MYIYIYKYIYLMYIHIPNVGMSYTLHYHCNPIGSNDPHDMKSK